MIFNINHLDFFLWFKKEYSKHFYSIIFLVFIFRRDFLFDPFLLLLAIIVTFSIYLLCNKIKSTEKTITIDKWLIYQPFILWCSIVIPFLGFDHRKTSLYDFIYEIIKKDPSYLYLIIMTFFFIYIIANIYLIFYIRKWNNNKQVYKYKIKYLCNKFNDPPKKEKVFHYLAYKGDIQKIKNLFRECSLKKEDIYKANEYGYLPIHMTRSIELISYLISKGVDINVSNIYSGQTLLHLAARRGDLKLASFLIQNGADINKKDMKKRTPLKYAKDDVIKKLLIERGKKKSVLYKRLKNFFKNL